MSRKSSRLSWLKNLLWDRASSADDASLRADYRFLHRIAKESEGEVDEIVKDAEMRGLRNPAFPDDLVGWLDDDFTLPEEPPKKGDDDETEK